MKPKHSHKKGHTSHAQASDKPAILLTGATHPRELVTIQMVFNSLLTLLGGIVNNNQEIIQMVSQNRYYFIPVINPDALVYIE